MFAVEPKDIMVEINPQTGREEVKRRPNWISQSGHNANDIRAGIVNRLLMRQKFYLALSIPVDKLDALPDEFLLKSDTERLVPERLGVHWQNRYERIFGLHHQFKRKIYKGRWRCEIGGAKGRHKTFAYIA